jgi:pimeloyl-ACP methyl ester carboxylesterase
MSVLQVPGVRLYYELRGQGPLLLLIPGANGDATVFQSVADELSSVFTVVTYDRRGFTRSSTDVEVPIEQRLSTDADDARRLIEYCGDGPAHVFGTSSGAVVALRLVLDHPQAVRTAVVFEPAAMRLFPQGEQWIDFFHQVYDSYRRDGIEPAMRSFREKTFPPVDHPIMAAARSAQASPHTITNATLWFESELRQYTSVTFDTDDLVRRAHQIVPAVGEACRGYPNYSAAQHLGITIGREVLTLPGGHVGYASLPVDFAEVLRGQLDTRVRRSIDRRRSQE